MNQISDYAIIGDCHSLSLVGKDGSIDWCCFPHFDSPSVFAKVLDEEKGGYFRISPKKEDIQSVLRRYIEGTNVLETVFTTKTGKFKLTDSMTVWKDDVSGKTLSNHSILRKLEVIEGEVDVELDLASRFEYASFVPRYRLTSDKTGEIVGGADALWITSTLDINQEEESFSFVHKIPKNDTHWIELSWSNSFHEKKVEDHPTTAELERRFQATVDYWNNWIAGVKYNGLHKKEVYRSALTLKALTFAPTGAIVAAPTTSLPEEIGGVRNWDYRYTWIRDTSLTLISFMVLGLKEETDGFRQWLRRTSAGRPQDLQIMYSIEGRRELPEIELKHLSGHRNSVPVRIGNGAVKQKQLDVYGQILEATYIYSLLGGSITETNWKFLSGLADLVCKNWREPDQGIWEIRDEPRHFVHSKLMCWVALDRAVKIAEARELSAPIANWKKNRDDLYSYLINESAKDGWFPQATGMDQADASCLLVPALGLLPPNDPLVDKTILEICKQLESDGMVFRYHAKDGLAGGEGGFLLCSFWLMDALIHSGKSNEAEAILEKIFSLSNDVGLYAEEAEMKTGEQLGNFPQAFTHMALVSTCAYLTYAKEGRLPKDSAYSFAEFAVKMIAGGSLVE